MRFFGLRSRGSPKSALRRIDRVAGELNALLVVVAIGLLILDLLYLAQNLVDALPPVVHAVARMPWRRSISNIRQKPTRLP